MSNLVVVLQELYSLASLLCDAATVPGHWALLSAEGQKSDSCMYHTFVVTVCAVQCVVHQQLLALPEQQQLQFLSCNKITASVSSSKQHALLRPPKKRKSHQHKRASHKRQRRSLPEDWMPSSGEESLSDSDLGIMLNDQDAQQPQQDAMWQLSMESSGLKAVQASTAEVPNLLLCHVITQWLQTLQDSGLAQ